MDLLYRIVVWLVKMLVALRYRVEVVGLNNLTPQAFPRSGGILFLPNHPAEIDPVILMTILGPRFQPHPLVVEHFYHLKGFHFCMRLVKALPLPTMDTAANRWRGKKIQKQFQNVVSELKNKENFLIYPSGKLKRTGLETIGGSSFVHDLLQACPEAHVVLIRTTGLWGSQFSRALTGNSPDFGKTLWNSLKIILKNGIFFVPRRRVKVELEISPTGFSGTTSRLDLNKSLEWWYNRYPEKGPEPLQLVSFSFWKKELPEVVQGDFPHPDEIELKPISSEVQKRVYKQLSSLSQRSVDQIDRRMHLSHDLGLDSLDVVQLYVFLSEEFEVDDLLPGELQSVEDVMQAAAGLKKEREGHPERKSAPFSWPEEPNRPLPGLPQGRTIQEAFLLSCDRMKNCAACVDAISGLLTYRRMKLGVLILSEKLGALSETHVGVMLPASSGAYMVILAILLAGKVPVMINWKSGVKALNHGVDMTGLKVVISSDRFLDRLEDGDLGKVEEMLLLMEDIRKGISWRDKLKGILLSWRRTPFLLRHKRLNTLGPNDPAVVLFTSGTEALPKGVPLSHHNLLSDQSAAINVAHLNGDDIFYGVLPPFHSFGFSVTGLLCLLAGIRICYSPDPTDSHGMAHDIRMWKPTLFCCAPSFFRALFHVAKPEDLQSLRYLVAGAEKAPEEVFTYVREKLPHAQALEGYGITECGPVVTLTRPEEVRKGVGKPLPGIHLEIIDGEKHPLPVGQEGEVCIRGPNVFEKYLGSQRNPFVVINGEKWYASGDRGFLDTEGNLTLSGRLKRFVKIGGEMVSLGGLEEEFLRIAQEKGWVSGPSEGPTLAVSIREREADKPLLVLYTVFSISLEDVNAALKGCGYGRLVKISEVKQLDQIPLTGTGKTHYRLLDELC